MLADYAWLAENVFDASPVFFPMSVFSVEAYTAAVALAISRSVIVTDADGVATPMLLPLLDLPNHDGANPGALVQARVAKDGGMFGQQAKAPPSAVLVATREFGPVHEAWAWITAALIPAAIVLQKRRELLA